MKVSPDALHLKALFAQAERLRETAERARHAQESPSGGAERRSGRVAARAVDAASQSERQQPQRNFTREAPTRAARPKFVAPGQVLNILV